MISETLHIKNMVSGCCIMLLRERLEAAGIIVNRIQLGQADISYPESTHSRESIHDIIAGIGLDLVESREEKIVEQIKLTVIELIHYMNNVDSIARKSDYLVEKLGYSYPYLSKLFSAFETITLEKYIILQKIERIKELIYQKEFTLSEIAYMMDYSSVQYLSGQFHKITGITVTQYRDSGPSAKKPIEKLSG